MQLENNLNITYGKINKNVIEHMKNYKHFEGHIAFILTPNNKKILFIGKSRPIGNYNDYYGICSLHAEKVALENLTVKNNNGNNKYNILIFKWNKHGQLCLSKPCRNCMKCIKKKNINKVFYSIENGIILQLSKDMIISDCYVSSGHKKLFRIRNK